MKKEITVEEGNRIIAEFMGKTVYPIQGTPEFKRWKGKACDYHWFQLQYDKDWNQLMPVVEKIEGLGYHTDIGCYLNEQKCNIWEGTPQGDGGKYANDIAHTDKDFNDDSKIKTVWLVIIQFIQWYNTQNPTA